MNRKTLHRLTVKAVDNFDTPGDYNDGGGLYLQVSPWITKSWMLRYRIHGRQRAMGLGSYPAVTVKEARERASDAKRQVRDGVDPIEARNARALQARLSSAKTATFTDCASAYIESHRAGWANPKHAAQWSATLETYAYPVFGPLPVQAVDTTLVMKCVEPIWREKTETASRVRGRIESVLDWAKVRGYRDGENPARWRGHLDKLLPARTKVTKVKHHAAMPYADMAPFMRELRGREGIAPKALEFVILTAARVSEAVNAKWSEFNLNRKLWTVPAERMKAKREHRVPLSSLALKLLERLEAQREGDYVFPGWTIPDKPLTGAACLTLLDDMGHADLTTHGFRSSFRDWAAEQTNFPREIAEAALGHVLSNKTEAAYQRGDLLDRRGLLMQAWAQYCTKQQSAKVISLGQR